MISITPKNKEEAKALRKRFVEICESIGTPEKEIADMVQDPLKVQLLVLIHDRRY